MHCERIPTIEFITLSLHICFLFFVVRTLKFYSFFFLILFIYLFILFMVVLGLRFCARAFPSCGKWGPLLIAVRGPLTVAASCCGAQASDAQAQQLWLSGLAALRHVGSSQTRARTRVPCIGRQTLNHCATREAPSSTLLVNLPYTIQCCQL